MWSEDLALSASGDLALADETEVGRQRVLRRLLTNPGDYLWHTGYGAGLPQKIGSTASATAIEANVRRQMLLEPAVARDPAPVVKVTAIFGGVLVQITYTDRGTGRPVALGFSVER